jgi:serine/threonine protein kinase
LLLDKEGRVKIADFGIAKMLDAEGSNTGLAETQTVGTPQYMTPEQRTSPQAADHRADIYSLANTYLNCTSATLKLEP